MLTMKQYLVDFFNFNKWANTKLLEAVLQLPDKEESIKLFGNFITAQDKWLNRITHAVDDSQLNWSGPSFATEELGARWIESVDKWLLFLNGRSEESLEERITFSRPKDGKQYTAMIRDVILQINYHSIHHRAQLNRIIRLQGLKPPVTDYILTAVKEA
jgi:uncharacterized damage-inducible protein DinB